MQPAFHHSRRRRGFTLVELMLVLALIAALAALAWRAYAIYLPKGESVACAKKMRNFGVALAHYLSDKGTWPQEDVLNDPDGRPPPEDKLWDWWYKELKPDGKGGGYGITHDDWFCPTDLRLKKLEKKTDEANGESDAGMKSELENPSYIPAKFDYGPYKPLETKQPWMIERVGHGNEGMNKVMPDGTIQKEFNFKAIREMRDGKK